jgi:hypothetical protein
VGLGSIIRNTIVMEGTIFILCGATEYGNGSYFQISVLSDSRQYDKTSQIRSCHSPRWFPSKTPRSKAYSQRQHRYLNSSRIWKVLSYVRFVNTIAFSVPMILITSCAPWRLRSKKSQDTTTGVNSLTELNKDLTNT